MRRSLSCAAVLTALGAVLVPTTATAATCAPTVLPSPPGATVTAVTGTDDAGTYVGIAYDGTDSFGVRWRDGQVERLPENFVPLDMNRAGVLAGSMELQDFPTSVVAAALMAPDGTITYLDTGYSAGAAGLNERGDAVGWVHPEHPIMHLVTLWRAGGQDSEYFADALFDVRDIDDEGHILGNWDPYDTPRRVWDMDGNVLREFGPYAPGEVRFDLADIDDGRLAATRVEPDGSSEVYLLELAGGRDAPLPGSSGGQAAAVNNGVVVGVGPRGAMLWRRSGATALPAPDGMTVREATVVSGDGTEAAGVSVTSSGETVATVWRCG